MIKLLPVGLLLGVAVGLAWPVSATAVRFFPNCQTIPTGEATTSSGCVTSATIAATSLQPGGRDVYPHCLPKQKCQAAYQFSASWNSGCVSRIERWFDDQLKETRYYDDDDTGGVMNWQIQSDCPKTTNGQGVVQLYGDDPTVVLLTLHYSFKCMQCPDQ